MKKGPTQQSGILDLNRNTFKPDLQKRGNKKGDFVKGQLLLKNMSSKYMDLSTYHSQKLAELDPTLAASFRHPSNENN